MTKEVFEQIAKRLSDILLGTKFDGATYIVGGAVRDYVMGNEIKDIDIVVERDNGGIDLAEWLYAGGYLAQRVVSYPTYGTAMFKLKDFPEYELEAVYTRGEKYTEGSRNPETHFSTIQDDAFRRDLTINALYYNIKTGQIEDFTGKGLGDIKNQILRVTNDDPDIVFSDDPLRILRVIRFAGRFGWDIEETTMKSMVKNAPNLKIISQERITSEFSKMLTSDNHIYAMKLLVEVLPHFGILCDNTGLLGDALRNSVMSNIEYISNDVISKDLCVRLACLLDGNNLTSTILKYMKYPNVVIDEVAKISNKRLFNELIPTFHSKSRKDIYSEIAREQYRCGNNETFNRVLEMMNFLCKYHTEDYEIVNKIKSMSQNIDMCGYKLPINGNDMMQVLNCEPSEYVSIAKLKLLEQAFQNPEITAYECVEYLKSVKNDIMDMKL